MLDTRGEVRTRRRAVIVLTLLATALLILAAVGIYAVEVASPGPDLFLALALGVTFAGLLCALLVAAIYRTIGDLPDRLRVTADGFSVTYPNGKQIVIGWVAGRPYARLVDGSLLGERPTARRLVIHGQRPFSLSQEASDALIQSARTHGSILHERSAGMLWEGKLREYVLSCESR